MLLEYFIGFKIENGFYFELQKVINFLGKLSQARAKETT